MMFVPRVESLEPRQMMSAVPSPATVDERVVPHAGVHQPMKKAKKPPAEVAASLSRGGTLTVAGTGGHDGLHVVQSGRYITVARSGKGGRLVSLASFRTNKVGFVAVHANAGNDFVDCTKVYRPCVIDGGDGNDFIYGSDYVDDISGGAGNDEIHGREDGDYIEGGDGNDTLSGQEGNDVLVGGAGRDNLMGGLDDDELYANDGAWHDYIAGGSGKDVAYAEKNHDHDVDGEWTPGYWERNPFSASDIEVISGS
jgi:hypothetical protein